MLGAGGRRVTAMHELKRFARFVSWDPRIAVGRGARTISWPGLCFIVLMMVLMAPVRSLAEEQEFECIMEPYKTVKIGSPAAGILAEVNVARSDMVDKGQVVGKLQSDVERATVDLAKERAASTASLKAAKLAVDFERRRLERNQKLYDKKVISDQKLDEVKTELAMREQEVKTKEEQLRVATLELKRSQAVLSIRTIKSSVDGIVVERSLSPGEFLVNEGHIVSVAQIDPLNVEVFVPLQYFPSIRVGMQAVVRPEAPTGGELEATVTVVDKVFDAASRTFGVRLQLPNPENQIPAGLRCTVKFETR